MTILQESIFQAWRDKKVLSLVSFDVKGAYNGVTINVLAKRLRRRGIPNALVDWITCFCSQRKASVVVNGHSTEKVDLPQAGLSQGSPLSPILFLFFNADLVSSKINRNKGAIAFMDDYTAWVTGASDEETTNLLQGTVVAKAEQWARSSGATFKADKTAFIHFTRRNNTVSSSPLFVNEEAIRPQTEVKILGVVFDQKLRFSQHTARAAKRGIRAALALKRIKGMTVGTARQLFTSTVTPTVDYASPIWSTSLTGRVTEMLNQIQRIGTQAIIGAFRTVTRIRAEMEAGIEQLTARMHRQEYKFWVKCHALPVKHPWWKIRWGIDTQNKRFPSPLQRIAMQLESVDLTEMERIYPFCIPLWQQGIEAQILEGEEAQKWAEDSDELKVFVDASYRGHNAGVGVYHSVRRSDNSVVEHREVVKIGKNAGYTSTHVELTAIQAALELISAIWSPDTIARFGNKARDLTYVIVSDSQSAIRTVSRPSLQSGQAVIRLIVNTTMEIKRREGLHIRLQWVPAHAMVVGDEIADELAKQATEGTLDPIPGLTLSAALKKTLSCIPKIKLEKPVDIDTALPRKHTKSIYDLQTYKRAAVLCQLRTGKCRLNRYLAKIGATNSDRCTCQGRQPETVRHFVFECPLRKEERKMLQEVAGNIWGDLSFFLGGRFEQRLPSGELLDGKAESWKPNLDVVNQTIEFAMVTGLLC